MQRVKNEEVMKKLIVVLALVLGSQAPVLAKEALSGDDFKEAMLRGLDLCEVGDLSYKKELENLSLDVAKQYPENPQLGVQFMQVAMASNLTCRAMNEKFKSMSR
jgi:hypothetical protein